MFSGWYDNHEFKGSPVTSITVSDTNYTFYGRWTSAAVEVDLNKDDSNTNRFEKTLTNAEKLNANLQSALPMMTILMKHTQVQPL